MKRKFERYCGYIENVENYEAAKNDNFKGWHCHHRLETHTSDGERRLIDISAEELQALGMFYHRPPEEFISLTEFEHHSLHNKGKPTWNKGKHLSEETRKKMSESAKGKNTWSKETSKGERNGMYGKHHSEEAKHKMSEAHKGKPLSEENKRHISKALKGKPKPYLKGKHWKLVDGKRVYY